MFYSGARGLPGPPGTFNPLLLENSVENGILRSGKLISHIQVNEL